MKSAIVGDIAVERQQESSFTLDSAVFSGTDASGNELQGVELLKLSLRAATEAFPPKFTVRFSLPLDGACNKWNYWSESGGIPPDWGGYVETDIARGVPIYSFVRHDDSNRVTVACSETSRFLTCRSGVREENCHIVFEITFFSGTEAPISSYDTFVRIDVRNIGFAAAITDASRWIDSLPGNAPCVPPPAAFEPLYSSWYDFHQDVFADKIEAECALATEDGMKVLIVDDGWQTDDTGRGYAFCGDWEISRRRFPDMRAHVARVHALGMKYMVWYSVPFVGHKSASYERFKGKYLFDDVGMGGTAVLDPRFPEVRRYLVETYARALREWDIDGFKLDFIDRFVAPNDDPAFKDNFAGRDIKSVPEAVDRLLYEITSTLLGIKQGLLFEFRQHYIGPTIRKYGNMLRASDCPASPYSNHIRIANLRLTSGKSAVHSDMLEWHPNEKAETAALQVLACLFGVVQYSMNLGALPADHREMVRHWVRFTTEHKNALLHGEFDIRGISSGYPVLEGWNDKERIAVVYGADFVYGVTDNSRDVYLVNATGKNRMTLRLSAPRKAIVFDTFGNQFSESVLTTGLHDLAVPQSGYVRLID